MCLSNSDGDYFYCHRDTYDKAVILSDRYTLESISKLLPKTQSEDNITTFYETLPAPLKILAPFLNLVKGEIEEDVRTYCGVLQVITSAIDIRKYVKVDAALRNEVSFSLSITEEFEMAWDSFFLTCIPYTGRIPEAVTSGNDQFVAPAEDTYEDDMAFLDSLNDPAPAPVEEKPDKPASAAPAGTRSETARIQSLFATRGGLSDVQEV